ncbi:MAG: hypothetical protein ACLRQF_19115 [Thomasclavelia ramosa]
MKSYQKIETAAKELVKTKNLRILLLNDSVNGKCFEKNFYALYHDKYEVIERIVVDNVISDLKGMLELLGKVELNQPIILEKMYQHFYDEKSFM